METFTYEEVMKLGFKRKNASDKVWERQYGHEYFIVWKELPKGFQLQWDVRERTIELLNLDEDETIVSRMDIPSRKVLENILNFLIPGFDDMPVKDRKFDKDYIMFTYKTLA